ncbi:MAG: DUF1844 domain-containing protein [Phycisphaerae bacterium]|jgi:hypothetical protein
MSEDKKIIIDSDWKEEVKKNKAKLAEQESEQTEETGDEMPEASFEILVNLLATQAAYGLGLIPSENGDPVINFPVSKLNIDLLGILEEKCKNNLSEDEKHHLGETLNQLRMSFVYLTQAAEAAHKEAEGK